MSINDERLEALRNALRETTGNPQLDAFLASQMMAAMPGDEAAWEVYRQETGPVQAQFDIHIDGDTVVNHAASAKDVSDFIKNLTLTADRLSQHKSEQAKTGKSSKKPGEYLLQAITPGSLKITIAAPDPEKQDENQESVVEASTAKSQALRDIAELLEIAQSEGEAPESPQTKTAVENLPFAARSSLKTMLEVVDKQKWTLEGELAQRHKPTKKFTFTDSGRVKLSRALEENAQEIEISHWHTPIDGFRQSQSHVYLIAPSGKSLAVKIPETDNDLFIKVRELARHEDAKVVATVQTEMTLATGSSGEQVPRTAKRTLLDIQLKDTDNEGEQTAIDMDQRIAETKE